MRAVLVEDVGGEINAIAGLAAEQIGDGPPERMALGIQDGHLEKRVHSGQCLFAGVRTCKTMLTCVHTAADGFSDERAHGRQVEHIEPWQAACDRPCSIDERNISVGLAEPCNAVVAHKPQDAT